MRSGIKNYTLRFLLFWILWASLHVLILKQADISFKSALLDSLISNFLLLLTGLIVNNILIYYQPGPGKAWYVFLWCLLLASIWYVAVNFLIPLIINYDTRFIYLFNSTKLLRFLLAAFLITLSALSMWMTQLNIYRNEENTRRLEIQKLAKEAELSGIRQQLQPHFLFNTLNSISALATKQPEKARTMIQQLSDFLRGTIKKDLNATISLDQELQHIQLYLDIEKVRFENRLVTKIEVTKPAQNALIPPLILLPLIENAMKYGVYESLGETCIEVTISLLNNDLFIKVCNPYEQDSVIKNKGLGFGLNALSRRLFLLYGRADLLKISHLKNVFCVELTIPQIK